jgi:hypothetical protein
MLIGLAQNQMYKYIKKYRFELCVSKSEIGEYPIQEYLLVLLSNLNCPGQIQNSIATNADPVTFQVA